jgi:predicted nucleic acid-binding protein
MESTRLGLILDSDYLIAAERQGQSILQILEQIAVAHGGIDLGISVIAVAELTHGAYRTKAHARQRHRLAFIDRLSKTIPVYPVTLEIARSAGRLEGELAGRGFTITFEDLAVGVTALQLGFGVATMNRRHYELIPGLDIVSI